MTWARLHAVHAVHAVCPILLSPTNRATGTPCRVGEEAPGSAEQDKRNRVNSVNRVSRDRRRWYPFREPGGGYKDGTLGAALAPKIRLMG
jgi:hypothetical protein